MKFILNSDYRYKFYQSYKTTHFNYQSVLDIPTFCVESQPKILEYFALVWQQSHDKNQTKQNKQQSLSRVSRTF